MTWLLLQLLGLLATGLVYPNYQWVNNIVVINDQIQQLYQEEMDANYLAEQEQVIIEDYFLFLKKIGKITYARWCMWEYTPPSRNEEKQKRVRCSDNAFDCAGLIKAYGVAKGILNDNEVKHYNSRSMYELWSPKDPRTAKRWDFTSWQWFGDRLTGDLSSHFAIVSRDYQGDGILWVYDNVNWPNNNVIWERALKISYVWGKFYYLGKYKISVATNGLAKVARERWITVEPWIDEANPHWWKLTIRWYPYESMANEIANYRWDNLGTWAIDMILTMYGESGMDPWRVAKNGDSGVCQRSPIRHSDFIESTGFDDYMIQAKTCLDKRVALKYESKRANYRKAYHVRKKYQDVIIYIN